MDELGRHVLDEAVREYRGLKKLAEKALAQLADDAALHARLDPESNSLAVLIRHLAGNMRSRWTDFLTSDGEKPDRRRDREFENVAISRAELMQEWEGGWRCLFDALGALAPADLMRTVPIRSVPHTVVRAIDRQLTHYAQHVGQIVLLAKHLAAGSWKSLTIPRGESETWRPPRREAP